MHFDETNKTTKFKKTLLGVKNNIWTIAIGTPENPMAEELSEEENSKRRKSFESDVRQMHLFYKMMGRYKVNENSYLIANPNLKWLKYIFGPKKYNQESFIFGEVNKSNNTILYTLFEQEDGEFVVWDTCTEYIDQKMQKETSLSLKISSLKYHFQSLKGMLISCLRRQTVFFLGEKIIETF